MAIIARALARINSQPLACLGGADRVNEFFALAGHTWRRRLLDPANTLALFILQVLNGNAAITHLRHLSGVKVTASSYCAARMRLPLEALGRLVEWVCQEGMQSLPSRLTRDTSWLGRRVILADGTSASTPDRGH